MMQCQNCGVDFNTTELNYIEVHEVDEGNAGEWWRFCTYKCMSGWFGIC